MSMNIRKEKLVEVKELALNAVKAIKKQNQAIQCKALGNAIFARFVYAKIVFRKVFEQKI